MPLSRRSQTKSDQPDFEPHEGAVRFRGPDGGLAIKIALGHGMANSRFRFDDESLWKKISIRI
jgi:hypothetical protein